MIPILKTNAAAGYQGPVIKELLKDAGLLPTVCMQLKTLQIKSKYTIIIIIIIYFEQTMQHTETWCVSINWRPK